MKRPASLVAICMTLLTTSQPALSDASAAHLPNTDAAKAAAPLLSRAEQAISSYFAACAAKDAQRFDGVTTDDARVDYTLDQPGTYLSFDARLLAADCGLDLPRDQKRSPISQLWVFPTNDPNTVFIQYDVLDASIGRAPHHQLALVEMDGEKIARVLHFGAAPSAIMSRAALAAKPE